MATFVDFQLINERFEKKNARNSRYYHSFTLFSQNFELGLFGS